MSAAKRFALSCCLALAFGAAPAHAQTLAEKLNDARLGARAEVVLAQDEVLRAFTFRSTAVAGVVTVLGVVETAAQRDRVSEVLGDVEGVAEVVNRVQASGAPASDRVPPGAAEAAAASAATAEASPAPEPEPVEEVYHTVQSGDTLGAIARRHGVTVRQVQQLSGLRGTRIRAGQRLRVK